MDKIKQLIISNYAQLTSSEQHIAKTILNNPNNVKSGTVADLAKLCSVSPSTIVRFTRKINLEGFSELKVLMNMSSTNSSIEENFIDRIADNEIQLVNYYRKYDFNPIIKTIKDSPTLYAYGTGRFQQSFVKELQRLFMHIGVWIRLIDGEAEFKIATDLMDNGDTIIIVSSRGEDEMLNDYYDLLDLKKVRILSFTNSSHNSLVYASEYNISTNLNKEMIDDSYYFDNISSMYIPLKIFFARYIEYQIN